MEKVEKEEQEQMVYQELVSRSLRTKINIKHQRVIIHISCDEGNSMCKIIVLYLILNRMTKDEMSLLFSKAYCSKMS